jgi:hypothetical protein
MTGWINLLQRENGHLIVISAKGWIGDTRYDYYVFELCFRKKKNEIRGFANPKA